MAQPAVDRRRWLAALLLVGLVLVGLGASGPAQAEQASEDAGPARMQITSINLRGATSAGPYIAAISLRSAVMAACYGDRDFEKDPVAVEAFLTIGKKGMVRSLSLQSAKGFDAAVDTCVMEEINKARFPSSNETVEMSMLLSMGPLPEGFEEPKGKKR